MTDSDPAPEPAVPSKVWHLRPKDGDEVLSIHTDYSAAVAAAETWARAHPGQSVMVLEQSAPAD